MKRKIISGLESVTRNAVEKLCSSVPFFVDTGRRHLRGSVRKRYSPKMKSMMLPMSFIQKRLRSLSIKSITNDMPRPVTRA